MRVTYSDSLERTLASAKSQPNALLDLGLCFVHAAGTCSNRLSAMRIFKLARRDSFDNRYD